MSDRSSKTTDVCTCCGAYMTEGGAVCKNCISKSIAFDQVKWERDMAIDQLNSYGVGFCEEAELKKVIRANWIEFHPAISKLLKIHTICSNCGCNVKKKSNYCPDCGATMYTKIRIPVRVRRGNPTLRAEANIPKESK